MIEVDQHRFNELLRKRDRVGLSEEEADELGRALADRQGKPYSNARIERARAQQSHRARPSSGVKGRGRGRHRDMTPRHDSMGVGNHKEGHRPSRGWRGRPDATPADAQTSETTLPGSSRIDDHPPGPLASVKTGATSDPGHPQPRAAEVESARLLANQARRVLRAAGLSDRQIRRSADQFIAEDRGENLTGFIAWAIRRFQPHARSA